VKSARAPRARATIGQENSSRSSAIDSSGIARPHPTAPISPARLVSTRVSVGVAEAGGSPARIPLDGVLVPLCGARLLEDGMSGEEDRRVPGHEPRTSVESHDRHAAFRSAVGRVASWFGAGLGTKQSATPAQLARRKSLEDLAAVLAALRRRSISGGRSS